MSARVYLRSGKTIEVPKKDVMTIAAEMADAADVGTWWVLYGAGGEVRAAVEVAAVEAVVAVPA